MRERNYALERDLDYMRREEERKVQNFNNMKAAFNQSKEIIEKNNLEKSKEFFEKYISNTFLKEFEVEKDKRIEFKTSLISKIQKFTEEFMNLCQKFVNSFKSDINKRVTEFDIKEIEPIEHINFIVIGKAGVGKSSFINESLLLPEDKRAKEGEGESVTTISSLYSSDKLKMIRMWDTPGLDDKVTKDHILKEIKRLISESSDMGPDHYINVILYCTSGTDDRFQKEDEELIISIMNLYPFDDLPVVITQLQSYLPNKAKRMEKTIRNVLKKYDKEKAEKIEIRSIVSRDNIDENMHAKAHGIPELLRLSFDLMGRSISSATCKNIFTEIQNICKNFVNKKMLYANNIFKYEMEIIEVSKNLFIDNLEEENNFLDNDEQKNELSEDNIYKNLDNPTYFIDIFCGSIKEKLLDIFRNLENDNLQLNGIKDENNENIEQENNMEENHQQVENNNEQNNIQNENIEQNNENMEQQKNEEEKSDNEENEEEENNENNQIENEVKEKSPIELLVEKNLKKLTNSINDFSNKTFEKIFKNRYDEYLKELLKEQEAKNREFHSSGSIINLSEVENNFKEKLLLIYKNEFFKIFFCIILKLFLNNLKNNFDSIIEKELIKNNDAQEIIHQKAENSLKIITENLKEKLILELDNVMKEKEELNNEINNENRVNKVQNENENEPNNDDMDFAF